LETVKSAINGAVSKGLFRAYVSYHGARYSSVRRAAQEAEEQGYAVTVHETSHLLEVAW
jgi:CRISPR/Cas system-associated protein Cas5 (RAMP superfamily)